MVVSSKTVFSNGGKECSPEAGIELASPIYGYTHNLGTRNVAAEGVTTPRASIYLLK